LILLSAFFFLVLCTLPLDPNSEDIMLHIAEKYLTRYKEWAKANTWGDGRRDLIGIIEIQKSGNWMYAKFVHTDSASRSFGGFDLVCTQVSDGKWRKKIFVPY
jgi:hypothetical protein